MTDLNALGCGSMSAARAASVNSLVLAYVGDAVWSLFVRAELAESCDRKAGELHKLASATVNAGAQARLAETMFDILTDEERDVFLRGRNAKAHHKAKNQSGADYRKATAMEAVVGYLYLTGRVERIVELLSAKV